MTPSRSANFAKSEPSESPCRRPEMAGRGAEISPSKLAGPPKSTPPKPLVEPRKTPGEPPKPLVEINPSTSRNDCLSARNQPPIDTSKTPGRKTPGEPPKSPHRDWPKSPISTPRNPLSRHPCLSRRRDACVGVLTDSGDALERAERSFSVVRPAAAIFATGSSGPGIATWPMCCRRSWRHGILLGFA